MSNIAAAEITNADAIHQDMVSSENSKFSKICQRTRNQIYWCLSEMIDRMGDKASAKSTMIEAGYLVSRFCWYFRIVRTSFI
jgi:acetyl-CoA carboxylase biotin carboxylase subunit